MSLNHLKERARELVTCMEQVVLGTPELVEEELGRITWASFTGIVENLLITGVQEASGYIMVIRFKKFICNKTKWGFSANYSWYDCAAGMRTKFP